MNKVLFFDIDGTLAINKSIPKSNIEALNKLKEKGYLTFICSGRAPHYAKKMFKDLVSGYIGCNGRYIEYNGKMLHGEKISEEELNYYTKLFDKLECGYLLVSKEISSPCNLSDREVNKLINEYGKERIQLRDENIDYYTFDVMYKDLKHRDIIIESLKNRVVFNDHGGSGSGDCSTKCFDKGSAISYILNYFKIDKDHAYAFGDGYNDQAMFREVNNRIAMGNGVDVLKNKATYITDNIENEGIKKALIHEKILQNF